MIGASVKLPRDGSRQSEELLYGKWTVTLNRWTGIIILVFVMVHIMAQAILHVPLFSPLNDALPWLPAAQNQPWIHGILFAAVTFHALHGFKLIALDLGMRLDFRKSFWTICTISSLIFLREVLRYAGI